MTTPSSAIPVFIALQTNDDTRPIVEAITADNPHASVAEYPAMVKIDAPGHIVIRRASVSERLGRDWDVQEIHLNLISLSGNIDETDDEFRLAWGERGHGAASGETRQALVPSEPTQVGSEPRPSLPAG